MDITPLASVDELIQLLAEGVGIAESEHAERVDLLAHGLQCAEILAARHPEDLELQAAGLVHDLGHQLVPGDDAGHGPAGAAAVRQLLGDRVARLVGYHVAAKRFLVSVDADYCAELSPVSVRSLERQGGPMSESEIQICRSLPDWEAGLELRRADEAAKDPDRRTAELETWRARLEQVADLVTRC